MTGAQEPGEPGRDADEVTRRAARRRREQVFGDVLPDTTSDDRDDDREGRGGNDDWLRSNVPPHHG